MSFHKTLKPALVALEGHASAANVAIEIRIGAE